MLNLRWSALLRDNGDSRRRQLHKGITPITRGAIALSLVAVVLSASHSYIWDTRWPPIFFMISLATSRRSFKSPITARKPSHYPAHFLTCRQNTIRLNPLQVQPTKKRKSTAAMSLMTGPFNALTPLKIKQMSRDTI